MTQAFEIRPALSIPQDQYVHKALNFDDLDGVTQWENELQDEVDASEAQSLAQRFKAVWWARPRPISKLLADYPAHAFVNPVCSDRMWSVMAPFCQPQMVWLRLPMDHEVLMPEWGVVIFYSTFSADETFSSIKMPHFFRTFDEEMETQRFFVSPALRAALEKEDLVGLEFSPR